MSKWRGGKRGWKLRRRPNDKTRNLRWRDKTGRQGLIKERDQCWGGSVSEEGEQWGKGGKKRIGLLTKTGVRTFERNGSMKKTGGWGRERILWEKWELMGTKGGKRDRSGKALWGTTGG